MCQAMYRELNYKIQRKEPPEKLLRLWLLRCMKKAKAGRTWCLIKYDSEDERTECSSPDPS